ncbi:MAG: hypothetical protein LBD30_03550 [Verrucomicrobiales bacterium]|nr:hypothetical protein [Verrucomicrobiales bacterium]
MPDYPRRGEPLQETWGRQLVDYLRSITPRSSAGCRVSVNPGGATFDPVIPRPRVTAGGPAAWPYQCSLVTEGGDKFVAVEFGLHNNHFCAEFEDLQDEETGLVGAAKVPVSPAARTLAIRFTTNPFGVFDTDEESQGMVFEALDSPAVPPPNFEDDLIVFYQPIASIVGDRVSTLLSGCQWFSICGREILFGVV